MPYPNGRYRYYSTVKLRIQYVYTELAESTKAALLAGGALCALHFADVSFVFHRPAEGALSARKAHREGRPLPGAALQCDAALVQGHNFPNHGQAQAVALGFVAGIGLVKLVKNPGLGLRFDTRALVGDGHADRIRAVLKREGYHTAFGRKFDRIVQQVDPHFLQQRFAAGV